MAEVAFTWLDVVLVAMVRLAPKGAKLTPDDMRALPHDRALVEDRNPERLELRWLSINAAEDLARRELLAGEKPTAQRVEGRWQKIACCLLWKLARDQTFVVRQSDLDAYELAGHKLDIRGHADTVELLFTPRAEAVAAERRALEQEGLAIGEKPAVLQ